MNFSKYYQELQKIPFPEDHVKFLQKLKKDGFEPKVIYDIGSAILSWTSEAKKLWPSAEIICFEAYEDFRPLYRNQKCIFSLLTDVDEKKIKFYYSPFHPGGNSYYKENNDSVFSDNVYMEKIGRTLDSLVLEHKLPLPDLVKMDVQGAEKDIYIGGKDTLSNAKYLIMEAQHKDYNAGAPKYEEVLKFMKDEGWTCNGYRFCEYGVDADYCFTR